tara:strand:- start:1761 stop:1934 length:174 start_codon:yes stop_codon:yes gene_type:complete
MCDTFLSLSKKRNPIALVIINTSAIDKSALVIVLVACDLTNKLIKKDNPTISNNQTK